MFKVKQVGVVLAMTLAAVSAMASNFRAADQVYLPIAGHFQGIKGETFVTDVALANLSDDAVDVSIIFSTTAAGTPKTFPKALTLNPRERREVQDFFGTVLKDSNNQGLLIFNACKKDQDCTPQADGENPNYRNISIESRIFSTPAGTDPATAPTTGQQFPGIPWYNFISSTTLPSGFDRAFITGLRNTGTAGQAGTYRTNIGLVNASQFSTTTLVATLFDGATGNPIGVPYNQTLSPLGQVQKSLTEMFGTGFTGATAKNGYVVVTQSNTVPTGDAVANGCTDGCPAFLIYGSMLDNLSDDGTTLESQYTKPLNAKAFNCIYTPDQSQCKAGATIHRAAKHQFP